MKKEIIAAVLLAVLAVNIISLLILISKDRTTRRKKSGAVTRLLAILSFIGGSAGVLAGLMLRPGMRTRERVRTAAAAASVWVILLLGGLWLMPKIRHSSEEETSARITTPEVITTEATTETSSETQPPTTTPAPTTAAPTTTTEAPTKRFEQPAYVSLISIGDMLMHPPVSALAIQPDGSYDYRFIFEPIQPFIDQADIAIVNNEVPFGGNEIGLQDYPLFNVVTELGDEEVRAGFDVVLCATNHVLDQNVAGLENTMNYWKQHPQVTVLGVHETEEDQYKIKIVEKNGIRIAMFNYTYGINSYGVPKDRPYLVDLLREEDKEKIRAELEQAEKEADFTIVFPHWGYEYHLVENDDQRNWATFFTECGADLIIGTHPHVLQPVRAITSPNGNQSLCYYSVGNYISAQDETFSVLGGMPKITLEADDEGTRIVANDIQYFVTHYDANIGTPHVVLLENYTQEEASRHGIVVNNLPGNGYNVYYPFSVDMLHRIVAQVEGRLANAAIDPATQTQPAPPPPPETPAPQSETPAPAPETPAPQPETPAPETQAPETPAPETPAPEPDTPAPEQDTPAPEPDTPAPEQDTPAPEPDTPAADAP